MKQDAVSITETKEHTIVKLKCGHTIYIAPHFCVKKNDSFTCHKCDKQK